MSRTKVLHCLTDEWPSCYSCSQSFVSKTSSHLCFDTITIFSPKIHDAVLASGRILYLRVPVVAGGCIDNSEPREVSAKMTSGLSRFFLHRSSPAFSNHFLRAEVHPLEKNQTISTA